MNFSLSGYLQHTSKKIVSIENGKLKRSSAHRAFAKAFGYSNILKLFQKLDELDYDSLSTRGVNFRGLLSSDQFLETLSKELNMSSDRVRDVLVETSTSFFCAEYRFLSGAFSIDTALGIGKEEKNPIGNKGFCFPGFTSIYIRHSSGEIVGTQSHRDILAKGNQDDYFYTTCLNVRDIFDENGKWITPNQDKFLHELLAYINHRCPDISIFFRTIDLTESGEEYLANRNDCIEKKIPQSNGRAFLWNPSSANLLSV